MRNFKLKQLPDRPAKPRNNGLTMVMDKGLSLTEAANFIEANSEYVDLVKLGFGTSMVSPNLAEKIKLYKEAGIRVYFGGTLFEAFIVRNQYDDFLKVIDKYKLEHVEVSDGSIEMPHNVKLEYINKISKHAIVLSEVGSKDVEKIIPPYQWIEILRHVNFTKKQLS